MSEVKRTTTWFPQEIGGSMLEEVVRASDYDAAQSELSALREENERLKSESFEELYNAAIDERDAMREELAEEKERSSQYGRAFNETSRKLNELQPRLTAAEQRNARLESLLHRSYGAVRACNYDDLESDIDEVLKPTESGASE